MTGENPFLILTPKQARACGRRIASNGGVVPLQRIAEEMGITRQAVAKLIRKGLRRLDQAGIDLKDQLKMAA